MTQMVKSLVQCNKCNSAGHPNQMIGFLKTDKRKADGRPFWDLINEDGSAHVHKTTDKVVLPDIEEQPLHKTSESEIVVTDTNTETFTPGEIRILKELMRISLVKVRQ